MECGMWTQNCVKTHKRVWSIYIFGKSYFGFYVLFILCLIPSPDRTWSHILHLCRQPGMSYHPFIWIIQQNVFHISPYFIKEYQRRVKERSSLTYHLKLWLVGKTHKLDWLVCTVYTEETSSTCHTYIVTIPPQHPPVYNSDTHKDHDMILWVFSDETWLRTPVKGYTIKKGERDVTDQTLPGREIIFSFFYCSGSGTETCIEWVAWQFCQLAESSAA
jgi:hypothetical protein